jgi:hypothetical protein
MVFLFTSVFEPEKWNKNSLVVDAWLGSVYTQEEFCIVNKKSPHYDISNDFSGKIQHITKYVKNGVSYRTYEKNHMVSQVAMF